jgi:hypothetical protein
MILCALLLAPLPAAGQTVGNLPPDFYPQPKCEKPEAPGKVPEAQNQAAMQAYNAKVKKFNGQAEAFNACMKDYRDRAQNDINVILATVHAAVTAANQP